MQPEQAGLAAGQLVTGSGLCQVEVVDFHVAGGRALMLQHQLTAHQLFVTLELLGLFQQLLVQTLHEATASL